MVVYCIKLPRSRKSFDLSSNALEHPLLKMFLPNEAYPNFDIVNDWLNQIFYAVSAIFQQCNGAYPMNVLCQVWLNLENLEKKDFKMVSFRCCLPSEKDATLFLNNHKHLLTKNALCHGWLILAQW